MQTVQVTYMAIPGIRGNYMTKLSVTDKERLIMETVCKYFGVTEDWLKEKNRKRERTEARQICCYLLKKYTSLSLSYIGGKFGQDHTTAINAIKTVKNLMAYNDTFRSSLNLIECRL